MENKKHYHLGIPFQDGNIAHASFDGKPSKKMIEAVKKMCNIAYKELKKQSTNMRALIIKSEPHFWDYKHIGESFKIISEEYDNGGYMGYDVLYNDNKPAEGENVKFVTTDSIEVEY